MQRGETRREETKGEERRGEEIVSNAARGRAGRRNSPRAFALNTLLPFLLAYLRRRIGRLRCAAAAAAQPPCTIVLIYAL